MSHGSSSDSPTKVDSDWMNSLSVEETGVDPPFTLRGTVFSMPSHSKLQDLNEGLRPSLLHGIWDRRTGCLAVLQTSL